MEKTTFSVLFYICKTKCNSKGEVPICLRITVNGERKEVRIHRSIHPKLWNIAKGKASENGKGCKELNLYLDAVQSRLLRARLDLELEGATVTAQSVLNRYLGKDAPERHTVLELFREHNEKCRKLIGIDYAPATVERYDTCLKFTQEFMQHIYHRNDMYWDELSRQFVEDYEFYLKTVCRCCHNTATKYLKNFKKIVLIALKREWIRKDPFAEIRFHLEEVEPDFLESHELQRLIDKQIGILRLAQVRDVYVFCCFTGLAFSDVP